MQSELDRADIDYELVKGPVSRSKRSSLEQLSGQRLYPVIEFEDGSVYREESKDMAARIRAGKLMEARGEARPAQAPDRAGESGSAGEI